MSQNDTNKTNYDVPLADHEYDGIQELNNPAPFWWQLFFYLSIAFAGAYYFYYEMGNGPSMDKELADNMAEVRLLQAQNKSAGPNEDELNAFVKTEDAIKAGKPIYDGKCASCHVADGGGLVGPNLTDKFWIHGKGTALDIHKVVVEGVLDKGMPPWGSVLSEIELNQVVAYVYAMKGKQAANPKAAQGVEVN